MARRTRVAAVIGSVLAAGLITAAVWGWAASRLPDSYSAMQMGTAEYGGGPAPAHAQHDMDMPGMDMGGTEVSELIADPDAPADVHVELTARAEKVRIPGAEPFDGFTLNGSTPGPVIRAMQGQLVEVVLRNDDVPDGVTLHWHGVDVPNAMDGVAGVTQDAVMPGGTFTYRFVADQVGTYWYHSHQISHTQVVGGLFGALVITPKADAGKPDAVAVVHTYDGSIRTVNGAVGDVHADAAVEGELRVRIVNTDNSPVSVWVPGLPFRVLAVDGAEVHEPGAITDRKVTITAGGRADLGIRVPPAGATVALPGASFAIGDGEPRTGAQPSQAVDMLTYGSPAPLGFDPGKPDREFHYDIGRMPGFLDGRPGLWWTINGGIVPNVPMFMVTEGDIVVMRISNGSGELHPMHLHGHHAVVLSRNGVAATGSPWWVDSLTVEHGDTYEIAFVADNPGIWMDHCHNLPHAAEGLMTHLAYEGVTTPYRMGRATGNTPE
ncbi:MULTISPECIES: multicopper oxidase family protein [unclassified Microbacterium]|uniref:multicopper oxidase family protein n=1 Tax=unclassified Microbacterium TaxID=2609290 RepID=UPI0012F7DD77|nr:multicopper oxidase family protein [Microbacterium sp. MAH-37]MVQ42859.1 multicopper oxidase domain-containing protein [Microbacterium sp. MAH-37]